MEHAHSLSERQARELGQLIAASNAANDALRIYFSAVAGALDLPNGTQLVRVEENQIIVQAPA